MNHCTPTHDGRVMSSDWINISEAKAFDLITAHPNWVPVSRRIDDRDAVCWVDGSVVHLVLHGLSHGLQTAPSRWQKRRQQRRQATP